MQPKNKTGYRILLLFCLLSCIFVAVIAACHCEFTDNLSLAVVAHSRPHCCYYLPLAFGQFTHWLTPHTSNESAPNFPVKCIQQILCSCQFDNRFPTQPESIYKGMCVRAPMFISMSVCVCLCVCARSFLDFRQVGYGKLIQPARSRSRSIMQQPLPADYRLPFYFCWSPIFDFCLSTRCSYAPWARRECNAPQRLCMCVLCVCVYGVWSLCKLMTQILWHRWQMLQFRSLVLAFFALFFFLRYDARVKNQHQ